MKKIILAISILSILTACSSSDSKSNDSNSISKLKTTNTGKTKGGSLKDLNNSLVSVQNSNNSKSTPSHKSNSSPIDRNSMELKIQEPKDGETKIRINGKTTNSFEIKKGESYKSNINMNVELGTGFKIYQLIYVSGSFENKKTIEGKYIEKIIQVTGKGSIAKNTGILNPGGGIALSASSEGEAYNDGTINNGSMEAEGIDSHVFNNKIINGLNIGMKASDYGYAENNGTIVITGNKGIGMCATGDGSEIMNKGDIYLKGKNEIGMEVEDNATLDNEGTIHLLKQGIDKNTDISGNKAIVNNGGTITNHGTIEFAK